MTIAGLLLLILVTLRNDWAGAALADWRRELAGPADLAKDQRLWRAGGFGYTTGLLMVAAIGLLFQNVTANHVATSKGAAEVQD